MSLLHSTSFIFFENNILSTVGEWIYFEDCVVGDGCDTNHLSITESNNWLYSWSNSVNKHLIIYIDKKLSSDSFPFWLIILSNIFTAPSFVGSPQSITKHLSHKYKHSEISIDFEYNLKIILINSHR